MKERKMKIKYIHVSLYPPLSALWLFCLYIHTRMGIRYVHLFLFPDPCSRPFNQLQNTMVYLISILYPLSMHHMHQSKIR